MHKSSGSGQPRSVSGPTEEARINAAEDNNYNAFAYLEMDDDGSARSDDESEHIVIKIEVTYDQVRRAAHTMQVKISEAQIAKMMDEQKDTLIAGTEQLTQEFFLRNIPLYADGGMRG